MGDQGVGLHAAVVEVIRLVRHGAQRQAVAAREVRQRGDELDVHCRVAQGEEIRDGRFGTEDDVVRALRAGSAEQRDEAVTATRRQRAGRRGMVRARALETATSDVHADGDGIRELHAEPACKLRQAVRGVQLEHQLRGAHRDATVNAHARDVEHRIRGRAEEIASPAVRHAGEGQPRVVGKDVQAEALGSAASQQDVVAEGSPARHGTGQRGKLDPGIERAGCGLGTGDFSKQRHCALQKRLEHAPMIAHANDALTDPR